jgi:Xaa-Pro aminopeptidase
MNTPDPSQVVERLALLRAAMRQQQIDALMIPSADPHLSEYLPERWQGREWASGFTGSVGTLIVTRNLPASGPMPVIGPRPNSNWPAPASS